MPPIVNVDNIWELLLALIIVLAWGAREVLPRIAKSEIPPLNNTISKAEVRALIAEHANDCPGIVRIEKEISGLRESIDRLTNYLLNRKDS